MIVDNDPGIGFRMRTVYAHEDQGPVELIVLRGTDQLLGPFQVEYAITNLTASTADYATTNGILEFAAGQMSTALWIPLVNDGLAEADERLQVTLQNPTDGMVLGAATNVTSTVTNCDATGMEPNRFASVDRSPNGVIRLGLIGRTHKLVVGEGWWRGPRTPGGPRALGSWRGGSSHRFAHDGH